MGGVIRMQSGRGGHAEKKGMGKRADMNMWVNGERKNKGMVAQKKWREDGRVVLSIVEFVVFFAGMGLLENDRSL